MERIEQIDQGNVLTLHKFDVQVRHETAKRRPEIVAHQEQALDLLAVALTKGLRNSVSARYDGHGAIARTDRSRSRPSVRASRRLLAAAWRRLRSGSHRPAGS